MLMAGFKSYPTPPACRKAIGQHCHNWRTWKWSEPLDSYLRLTGALQVGWYIRRFPHSRRFLQLVFSFGEGKEIIFPHLVGLSDHQSQEEDSLRGLEEEDDSEYEWVTAVCRRRRPTAAKQAYSARDHRNQFHRKAGVGSHSGLIRLSTAHKTQWHCCVVQPNSGRLPPELTLGTTFASTVSEAIKTGRNAFGKSRRRPAMQTGNEQWVDGRTWPSSQAYPSLCCGSVQSNHFSSNLSIPIAVRPRVPTRTVDSKS